MAFSIIPRDENFFELFEEASDNVTKGAKAFLALANAWSGDSPIIQHIRDLEHEGDRMTHDIMDRLNRTFITPLDREDIHALTSELDDVLDLIQATTDRMQLYRINHSSPHLIKMAEVLLKSTESVGRALRSLRDPSKSRRTLDLCIEINHLENEGDTLLKAALGELFAPSSRDVLEIIKWKEIYEATEHATDKCEDIANVIEGIVVKNA